jgi:hypothetical protein
MSIVVMSTPYALHLAAQCINAEQSTRYKTVLRCFRWNERWRVGRANSPSPRPSPKGRGRIVRSGLGKPAQFGYSSVNRRGETMLRSRAPIPLKTAKNRAGATVFSCSVKRRRHAGIFTGILRPRFWGTISWCWSTGHDRDGSDHPTGARTPRQCVRSNKKHADEPCALLQGGGRQFCLWVLNGAEVPFDKVGVVCGCG